MKSVRLIRKDENAVSPVIATILMVAITVVLAAVLYVMVSGLLTGPGTGPRAMGVSIRATPDGTNWSVEIQTTPSGELPATTYVLIRNSQGVITLSRTAFSVLTWSAHKAIYQDATTTAAELRPGDSLLISKTQYPAGSQIEISDDAGVLTSRQLQ
ncbi:MAG: hypothetical protein A3K65_05920 [Euryarchaeota archaeon RBG_16_68_12]|nr:MAG: hypothetical protein A3K65_05920 [Euryarchaeota archaeon RBG_16_68_12]